MSLPKSNGWPAAVLILVMAVFSLASVGLAFGADGNDLDEENYLSVNMLSYRDAMNLGRDTDRPVFLHFTASYAANSGVQMKNTLADIQVIKFLNKNFAAATIDVSELPSLARKYHVNSVPTIWFLDPTGKRLTSVNSAMSVDKVLSVGEYVVRKIYEHTAYDVWADKQKKRSRGDGGH